MPSKTFVVATLASISCLAAYLIFVVPPSSRDLFPESIRAWETGFYPDGLALRRHYTGNYILDRIFTAYGGFFAAVVDGRDLATHLFCLWFLPQLCSVLAFSYWEAGRAKSGFVTHPMWVCIIAQMCTAGVTLPLYFASHVLNITHAPNVPLPFNAPAKARMLLPAIAVGFLLPSVALLVPPPWVSLDGIQMISAFWQPFPAYISICLAALQYVDSGADKSNNAYFNPLKRTYIISGLLAAMIHIGVLAYTLTTSNPAASFTKVFVPFWFHQYLPNHQPEILAPYRLAGRLLFQHDWFTMTIAAFVFFSWQQQTSRPEQSFAAWTTKLHIITIVGGPGAAICWAALKREEFIFEARGGYKVE